MKYLPHIADILVAHQDVRMGKYRYLVLLGNLHGSVQNATSAPAQTRRATYTGADSLIPAACECPCILNYSYMWKETVHQVYVVRPGGLVVNLGWSQGFTSQYGDF